MPSDHQSTEKEYPGWEPSKLWKSSGADGEKNIVQQNKMEVWYVTRHVSFLIRKEINAPGFIST